MNSLKDGGTLKLLCRRMKMPLRNQFETEAEWLSHMRMYFAAKAMPALIAEIYESGGCADGIQKPVAKVAYMMADAMLVAREVTP